MATREQRKSKAEPDGGDIAEMAKAIFERVRLIKKSHPEVARRIDEQEKGIRDRLAEIKKQIALLDRHEQDLVTLLVIQGLNKAAEEELVG